jgi:IS4 transposase
MTGRDEAARLRTCRETFELSIARGISMADARMLIARERWTAADRRLRERQCGTSAPRFDNEVARVADPDRQPWMMRD